LRLASKTGFRLDLEENEEGVALKAIGPVIFPRRNPGAGIGTLALQRIALRFQLEAVAVAS
jgi:hypothetical protein